MHLAPTGPVLVAVLVAVLVPVLVPRMRVPHAPVAAALLLVLVRVGRAPLPLVPRVGTHLDLQPTVIPS
ncbi:MAG TPA: hypothetical protein VGK35_04260 [Actinotalea sp.]